MADPVSPNVGLIEMSTGTASGTWGVVLNNSMIAVVDAALGSNLSVPLSNSNVSLTTTQRQNLSYTLTGTLTGNVNLSLPLGFNSTTQAVGGVFIFDNNTTGAFNVTVNTVVTGSLGVVIPQGVRSTVVSEDGTNVRFADDAQNQLVAFNGNPNANVAGFGATASQRASKVLDRSTGEEYLCATGTGSAAGAVWYKNLPYSFPAEGYLTANSDPTGVILTSDSIGASTIYYSALRGNQVWVYNGISFVPVTIPGGQVTIALSNSSQAANGIYDVMGLLNGTTFVAAFSPAWSVATAGSGSRGTGAGSPQLSRVNGILVNAVQQTANNGATTYTVGTSKGIYLGSVFIDSAAGQVTCHRSYGQSRKFGIWNAFNREPIYLKAGDNTTSWTPTSSWRPSNGNVNNVILTFCGLPEEGIRASFTQFSTPIAGVILGIGLNSTASPSGTQSQVAGVTGSTQIPPAVANIVPGIGVNSVYAMEKLVGSNNGITVLGTETDMLLNASYRG